MDKRKIRIIAVIIGILIIPLMYSFFYLKAFWDPYKTLSDVKVAVVNRDKGYMVQDEKRNLGNELAEKLEDNDELDFRIVSERNAEEGLYGKKYYAKIIIPKDFSKNISNLKTNNKKVTEIIYTPNEKKNYLAAQILKTAINEIEKKAQESITKEVIDGLTNELENVPIELGKVNNGLITLTNGTKKINNGANELLNGNSRLKINYNLFNENEQKFNDGVNEYYKGVNSLNSNVCLLKEKTDELANSTKGLSNIATSVETLQQSISDLDTGASNYVSNVDSVTSAYGNATSLLLELNDDPSLINDPIFQYKLNLVTTGIRNGGIDDTNTIVTNLSNGGSNLTNGTNTLKTKVDMFVPSLDKLNDLQKAIDELNNAIGELNKGTNTLDEKGNLLAKSSNKLANASNEVNNGINTLNYGTNTLADGTKQLYKGTKKAQEKVEDGINEANEKLCPLKDLGKYGSKPIKVKYDAVEPVPNYGTSFAPYFMSLSLWVGGIIILFGIYYDTEGTFKLLSRNSTKPRLRAFAFFGLGLLQGIVLGFILIHMLNLHVNHLGYYYMSICLVSLVFVTIIQFLMIVLKDIGKFLALLLLILQLTSCGGTFPMETVPKFFNVLYPYMPMTYSVRLFKETISGVNLSGLPGTVSILIGLFVIFALLTIFYDVITTLFKRKNKTKK